MSVCVCVCVCVCMCVCACVCMCMCVRVCVILLFDRHSLNIKLHHRLLPKKTKVRKNKNLLAAVYY